MPIQTQPIVFGPPHPGLDATQRRQQMGGEFLNVFRDRDGTIRRRPGYTLFKDFAEAGRPILGLYEPVQAQQGPDILVLRNGASAGVLARLTLAGVPTTLTTSSFLNNVLASFTETPAGEGRTYAANGGPINRIHMNTPLALPNLVVPITSGNAPTGVTHVGYAKTYLIANGLISGGISGDTNFSNDGGNLYQVSSSWRFFNNEQVPDPCTGIVIDHDEIASFGTKSLEISRADGVTPWGAVDGGLFPYGVASPYGISWVGGELIFPSFVDRQLRFVRIRQRQPEILSAPIEGLIQGLTYAQTSGFQSYVVAFEGQVLYVCNLPALAITLVYSPMWNEWYRWSNAAGAMWAPQCSVHAERWGKQLLGDRTDAKIWELNSSVATDNGAAVTVNLKSGQIFHGTRRGKRNICYRARFKRGTVTDGSTPQVLVSFADDGGTFSTPRAMSMGSSSQKYMTLQLAACGMYVDREIQLSFSSGVSDFRFIEMEEDFDVLAA